MKVWRLLDTGLRPAAENIALNRALLDARAADEIPNTLRFLRFEPCALLGYHQCASQELNLDYCRRENITVQRRITGGGAIWFDPGQLGWELYLHRRDLPTRDYAEITRLICETVAAAISRFGVPAKFRPRNDIEVNGRKISGTGGAYEGDAILYQGTLLLELDVERMVRVLRLPMEKLADKAISSLRERMVSLEELLGKAPGMADLQSALQEAFAHAFAVDLQPGSLSALEQRRFEEAIGVIDCDEWVNLMQLPDKSAGMSASMRKFPGGLLHATVNYDQSGKRIRQVWFTGDFFVNPHRAVLDLEAVLRDIPVEMLDARVRDFFSTCSMQSLSLAPVDFVSVILAAIGDSRI